MRRLRRKLEQLVGPRWPRRVRLLIVLFVLSAGFVCYHWRLMHAKTFGAVGSVFAVVLLIIRRLAWKSRAGRSDGD
jgi:uncharacterized BrkB/YihY/UPF0761 family membrane protein